MFISRTTREERVTIERRLNMLTMKETEAAYARFLSETNCKRLPKTADALFTQLEKQLRTLDENKTDGNFPAIAAALFRMVKAVSQNRSLLVEYGALMGSLATICEKGSEDDISLLRIFASSWGASVKNRR